MHLIIVIDCVSAAVLCGHSWGRRTFIRPAHGLPDVALQNAPVGGRPPGLYSEDEGTKVGVFTSSNRTTSCEGCEPSGQGIYLSHESGR
jgi:hypothetical protein